MALHRSLGLGLVLSLFASAFGCQKPEPPAAPSPAVAPAPPLAKTATPVARTTPVVVALVVDQLAAWIASERWPRFPASGGFARLVREGTLVPAMRYAHAVTDTAPGHAALFSGAVPRESGIFGNETIDAAGEALSVVRDDDAKLVYPAINRAQVSSSAKRLRVENVADRLRAAHPGAFVVSVSIKDRGAILPGGHRPTAAVWFDTKEVRFVTSTAFGAALPAWVETHGSRAAVMGALVPWERALPDLPAMTPDQQPGEGDEAGYGTTFPHRTSGLAQPGRAFRTHPAADRTLLALGLDALATAPPGEPALLMVSLSTHDYVGHVFGPDSVEAWEELGQLDASLGAFFAALDQRYGSNGWYAALSADHGSMSMPEVIASRPHCAPGAPTDPWERPCAGGQRIDTDALALAVSRAASLAAGAGARDVVRGMADPYVLMGDGVRGLAPEVASRVDAAIRRAAEAVPGVRKIVPVDGLPATCPPMENDERLGEDARIDALVCRSVAPKSGAHAGGYYVVTKPGAFFDARIVRGAGTSHGSPYLYDRTVPMVVRAPGRVAAGARVTEATDFRAFARTLSSLLGVQAPAAASGGRDLAR